MQVGLVQLAVLFTFGAVVFGLPVFLALVISSRLRKHRLRTG